MAVIIYPSLRLDTCFLLLLSPGHPRCFDPEDSRPHCPRCPPSPSRSITTTLDLCTPVLQALPANSHQAGTDPIVLAVHLVQRAASRPLLTSPPPSCRLYLQALIRLGARVQIATRAFAVLAPPPPADAVIDGSTMPAKRQPGKPVHFGCHVDNGAIGSAAALHDR